jgi:cyclopropane-fatty-acyl-phospholipid synthase
MRPDVLSAPQPIEVCAAWYEPMVELGVVPDFLIRAMIRRLLRQRIAAETAPDVEQQQARLTRYIQNLKASPIAIHTASANQQHYEVPAEFFAKVLGQHRKYSCGYWLAGDTLNQAELRMLELSAERAQIEDGHSILDLGCGWGAFSLYAAARFPRSTVMGVSNSASQREYIEQQARERGLHNLTIVTADINTFDPGKRFDRIVSIEMMEHVRNYQSLLKNVASWMNPQAKLFVHIFTHRAFAYPFEVRDSSDWMSQHFFTGGQMPSHNLLLHFQDDLHVREQWVVSGQHYQKTSEAWLRNMDQHRENILDLFASVYGEGQAQRWFVRWRIFFMACAELWGYRDGSEWLVSHYLFEKPA